MAIQPVAVDILKLIAHPERITGVITLDVFRRGPIAPVERDHQATGFGIVGVALIQISVRVVERSFLIRTPFIKRYFLGLSVIRPISPRLQIPPIQSFIHPLTQPGFHRLIGRPGVIHSVQENHHAWQVSRHRNVAIRGSIRQQTTRAGGDHCVVRIAHAFHILLKSCSSC
ncbi:hypothetical protein FQZ97_1038150 [compost metagenome]